MNIEDLIKGEKYLIDDNPTWEDGSPGALYNDRADVAYVVYKGQWSRTSQVTDAMVFAYDHDGVQLGDGEYLVAARHLLPYEEPPAADKLPNYGRADRLSDEADRKLRLLLRVREEMPECSPRECLAMARWVWGDMSERWEECNEEQ